MKRRTALMTPLGLMAAANAAIAANVGNAANAANSANANAPRADADTPQRAQRIATAWRVAATGAGDSGDRVGLLQVHWAEGRVHVLAAHAVPTRAHGLLALRDGGVLAVAHRPGRWLLRLDAQGAVLRQRDLADEKPARTLNGHVELSADGRWLYATETDPDTGAGWLSVRDAATLARVAQFQSHGIDPHQLLRAPTADGTLMVANGGIVRDRLGRKLPQPMLPSLVQLDGSTGALRGRWTLPDPSLSLRHMAWASGAGADGGPARLGIGLQAEHESPQARAVSPVLAVWDGRNADGELRLCGTGAAALALSGGYAGDISAGPGGGFVLSAQKAGRALWWHPAQPDAFTTIAEVTEPCGLLPLPDGRGVALSAGRGLARWHTQEGARMLPWPAALAPDNHWVVLQDA